MRSFGAWALRIGRRLGLGGIGIGIAALMFLNVWFDSVLWAISAMYDGFTLIGIGFLIVTGYRLLRAEAQEKDDRIMFLESGLGRAPPSEVEEGRKRSVFSRGQ